MKDTLFVRAKLFLKRKRRNKFFKNTKSSQVKHETKGRQNQEFVKNEKEALEVKRRKRLLENQKVMLNAPAVSNDHGLSSIKFITVQTVQ